jgi:hypothetical protein
MLSNNRLPECNGTTPFLSPQAIPSIASYCRLHKPKSMRGTAQSIWVSEPLEKGRAEKEQYENTLFVSAARDKKC